MKILYVYSNCSNKKYEELFLNKQVMILQQAQKYHSLLIDGLEKNGAQVVCVSGLPINRALIKGIYIKKQNETVNNIHYHYYGSINLPIFRQICLFLGGFISVFSLKGKKSENRIICDYLNISHAAGALLASKICKIKSTCLVTDIPGFMANDEKKLRGLLSLILSVSNKIYQYVLLNFDAYIFLTSQMNEIVNKRGKPNVVLEGHVDKQMSTLTNSLSDKQFKTVVLYAGSIHRMYGIAMLVEAFISAKIDNSELHIYGDGDYTAELIEICARYPQIKYFGIVANHFIIQEELKATLLVNPRPTSNDFTKYSFPSKNMEYMASGTPILTTKLPGMPPEYLEHVYLIDDESTVGLTSTLSLLLSKSRNELHAKGQRAKEFVLREKNNVVQAAKILKFVYGDSLNGSKS